MLRPMLPATVQVHSRLDGSPLWIEADGTQIQQVLMNLCVNAWHAMKAGTGHLEIGLTTVPSGPHDEPCSPGSVRRHAHLWVRDDGVGMDAATRSRIFEPFFTTKSGHGTGLGLAVVHGIVRAHGGTLRVDSTPGEGSCFHVYLPQVPPPGPQKPPPQQQQQQQRREALSLPPPHPSDDAAASIHVLYVDDDEVMGLMVEQLLQRRGHRVSLYQDARAALEALTAQAGTPDIAVCDYNMPHLSGIEFVRSLRRLAPRMPVIISSGYLPDEAQAEARRLGVRALMRKQDTFDELDALIRRVLSNDA
jgi:CheY-like chemotaxis protein